MSKPRMMTARAPIRRTQEERTELSDRRLVEAAVTLLIARGVEGTTLAAIGERAGYSRGLVTQRFGSKAGLLAYVHDTAAGNWIRRVQTHVGAAVGIDALERVVDALCGFIAEEPDEIRAMYLLRYVSIDPAAEYRANVARVHAAQRRDVQGWIEAGQTAGTIPRAVDAAIAAELFCAAADGLIYRWLVNQHVPVSALHAMLRAGIGHSLGPVSAARPRRAKS